MFGLEDELKDEIYKLNEENQKLKEVIKDFIAIIKSKSLNSYYSNSKDKIVKIEELELLIK